MIDDELQFIFGEDQNTEIVRLLVPEGSKFEVLEIETVISNIMELEETFKVILYYNDNNLIVLDIHECW